MWAIEIYPSLLEGAPIERHESAGTFGEWLDAAGIEWRELAHQPVLASIGGQDFDAAQWDDELPTGCLVKVRVIPAGSIGKLFKKIFKAILSIFSPRKKTQSRVDTPQSQNLQTTDAGANEPKLGAVVPELAGTFRRYPDYLVPPHRYFQADNATVQTVEFHACIGPGNYQILSDDVKIGNTPFKDIGVDRGEWAIYEPDADLSAVSTNEHWYSAPEVGATSGGSSGIELSAEVAEFNNTPSVGGYAFTGANKIIRTDGVWPPTWGVGTVLNIQKVQLYSVIEVTRNNERVHRITGNFRHLMPFETYGAKQGTGLKIYYPSNGQSYPLSLLDYSVDGNGDGQIRVPKGYVSVGNNQAFALSYNYTAYRIIGGITTTEFFIERVVQTAYDDPTNADSWTADDSFIGFQIAASSPQSAVNFLAAQAYGLSSALFAATPSGETTRAIEVDFFFPSGLSWIQDNGAVAAIPLKVGVTVTDYETGAQLDRVFTYTAGTVDQIGYTELIELPADWKPIVSVRRITKASTSTSVNDKVVWYGLKAKLFNRNSYPNWTTIGVKIRSGGKLGAGSENQINVLATRKLPIIDASGAVALVASPTREISAFLLYVARTIGYDTTQINMVELARLETLWRSRGETFDHIFDQTTVRAAMGLVLSAGNSDLTIDDGKLKPVRDGIRTVQEQVYSPQNMVGELKRSFRAPRPDDADGIEVDYMDATTWTRKTIVCAFSGSLLTKLEKMKIDGVTDRTRAWRLGMRRLREMKYRKWSFDFGTEMDALCSGYLSYVQLFDDLPSYHQSGFVIGRTGLGIADVQMSEQIRWEEYEGKPVVCAFRGRDGLASPTWDCTQPPTQATDAVRLSGSTAKAFNAWATAQASNYLVLNKGEPIHMFVGVKTRFGFPALITEVKPRGDASASVEAVNYDIRVYADDDSLPPV